MIEWPSTLPQVLLVESYQERPASTALRTEMDSGPAKVRQRYTAAPRPVSGALILTSQEKLELQEFYRVELKGGSLSFEWVDSDNEPAIFRFVAGADDPGYNVSSVQPGLWRVEMRLEILP